MSKKDNLPKAILFDLDNTLVTFIEARIAACKTTIFEIKNGNPKDLFNYFLRPEKGFENMKNITDYLSTLGITDREIIARAIFTYNSTFIENVQLYPKVIEVLSYIQELGIKMAIVTDASRSDAQKRLLKTGLNRFFPVLVTPETSGRRKPAHNSFLLAMQNLGTNTDNTWIVGDSIRREIYPGNEMKMTTIYATYGDWLSKKEAGEFLIKVDIPIIPDAKPVYSINSFEDLLKIIR